MESGWLRANSPLATRNLLIHLALFLWPKKGGEHIFGDADVQSEFRCPKVVMNYTGTQVCTPKRFESLGLYNIRIMFRDSLARHEVMIHEVVAHEGRP